ncbi:MAG: ECF transporter S component [Clostridium sp.]
MNSKKTKIITYLGLAVAINLIGCFVALFLRLPIYLDAIGTVLASVLFGPFYGSLVGLITSGVNAITFDPISIYFIPSQIVTAVTTGYLFKNGINKGSRIYLKAIIVGLATSLAAGTIVALVFGGVTTSGSSIIVAILRGLNVNEYASVYVIQALTEVIDKLIGFFIVFKIIRLLKLNERFKDTLNSAS